MASRDSALKARFFKLDAKAAAPLALYILNLEDLYLLLICLITMAFFGFLEYKGYPLNVFFRMLRAKACGPKRYSVPYRLRRGLYD